MRLVNQRTYAQKPSGRRSADHKSEDVLPHRLAGEQIPLGSRIIVAWLAVQHHRGGLTGWK